MTDTKPKHRTVKHLTLAAALLATAHIALGAARAAADPWSTPPPPPPDPLYAGSVILSLQLQAMPKFLATGSAALAMAGPVIPAMLDAEFHHTAPVARTLAHGGGAGRGIGGCRDSAAWCARMPTAR